jgi:hypothetical protein
VIFSIATVGAYVTYFKGQQSNVDSELGLADDDTAASLIDVKLTLTYGYGLACGVFIAKYVLCCSCLILSI